MSKSQDEQLAGFRKQWGNDVPRERDMEAIAKYHIYLKSGGQRVDDQTWNDLGMDDLFAKLDRTAGTPGRQVLYDWLRTYQEDDTVLTERAHQYTVFRDDQGLRESIQLLSARLDQRGSEWLAPLLLNEFPRSPQYGWLMFVSAFLFPTLIVAGLFFHPLFLAAFVVMFVNMGVWLTYGRKVEPYYSGFSQIHALLAVSEWLIELPDRHRLWQLESLRQTSGPVATLKKRLGWLSVDRSSLPEFNQALYGYLNYFFLVDILVYVSSIARLRQHQAMLAKLFQVVGSLDAAISVASYLKGISVTATPTLVDRRRIDVAGLYHPLIPDAVSNGLTLEQRSAVVAGPNMAGKTAFIRTVGINLILARTLHFCLAERATFPRAVVRSSIRREDELSEGQSYFFAEIEQILAFIRAGETGHNYLFLIDEIYRGTNTIERIAASAAVLRHLGKTQLVLATTHDLELQEILTDTFEMYHFSDNVADGKYRFDYQIHPGPARSRNAIKLLQISGYPEGIIAEAQTLAERLTP